jgi:hypothetical protein
MVELVVFLSAIFVVFAIPALWVSRKTKKQGSALA